MAANAKDVVSQVEKTNARKWKKELSLATKREKDWLANAGKIVKRYRGEEKKRNRYNVLWATTETLRPAIYNSKPNRCAPPVPGQRPCRQGCWGSTRALSLRAVRCG